MTQTMTAGERFAAEAVVASRLPAVVESYVDLFARYGAQERPDGCKLDPAWMPRGCMILQERELGVPLHSWLEVMCLEMEKLANESDQSEMDRRLAKITAMFIEWQQDRHRTGHDGRPATR